MSEGKDPIDRIEWREAATLNPNFWNPNRVHKPELRLIEHSIMSTGWMQPIMINSNNLIIDGFHRWRLSQDSKKLTRRYKGRVPCVVMDVPDDEAMLITVRINRAKGNHIAIDMHRLVAMLITDHGWTAETISKEIGATTQEVNTLAQEGIFAARNIAQWSYSPAWYPIEAEAAPQNRATTRPTVR